MMEMHDGWSESEVVPMTQPISPDEGDALRPDQRILMLLGGYRDEMSPASIAAFQDLARDLARTPPPSALDEVVAVLESIMRLIEAGKTLGAWDAAAALLSRLKDSSK